MRVQLLITAGVLLLAITPSFADSSPYSITADSVIKHISVLAHDSLEGREVGEVGEWKAAQYIQGVFEKSGLQPAGTGGGYLQDFDFIKCISLGEGNHLAVNGEELKLGEEFEPMRQSASTPFRFDQVIFVGYGITVPESEGTYDDYEGKDVEGKAVVVKRFAPPPDENPHLDLDNYSYLTDKISAAVDHGAAGLFFITPENQADTLPNFLPSNVHFKEIPVIFLRRAALERLGLDLSHPEILLAEGETELVKTRDTAYNVVGLLPAANDTTIMVGGHYDHLGWGGPMSLYRGAEKQIHNGADDNGSGVAAILELARYYSAHQDRLRHSLLFIAFSGEEAGVLGSSYYAKNMTVDPGQVKMMINLDMIGRLREQEKGLAVMGTGTSAEFKNYFDSLTCDDLKMTLLESGSGPSDHTAFYNRGIPSLSYFTGGHQDYHKPTDDIEFIDPDGIVRVTQMVSELIDHFDSLSGPLTFSKTKDSGAGKHRSQFSVTLGIMPDYMSEVKGVKIDAVSPERPAERAGMLQGDVVIKMGPIDINDIYDYMSALGKFRKGDSTQVVIERDNDTLSLPVVF